MRFMEIQSQDTSLDHEEMDSNLVLQERLNDVLLKVRHNDFTWRMPAHSLLLVNKSPVFKEMMDERPNDERPALLTLIGMRPETAVALLEYIYNDTFPCDVTADLLIASQRYGLVGLRHNLEDRVMSDIGVPEACDLLEELHQREPQHERNDCPIKSACQDLIEMHALTVFGSDLVLRLGKRALTGLLLSDRLNLPDEAFAFWAVWRWGRVQSSKYDRSLKDRHVQVYIDDLLVLIRRCSLRCKENIPSVALERFDRCKGRRSLYSCPPDILKHSLTLRPCPSFEDIIPAKPTEDGPVCIQISVEKDVMLVGFYLEMCSVESRIVNRIDSFVRVIREADCVELRRSKICWCETSLRKISFRGDPEHRLEAEVTLQEPLFLTPKNIYTIQLSGSFSKFCFVWSSLPKRRMKVGNTYVNFHGEGVTALREIYVIPDVSVSWGLRGPEV